MFLTLQKYLREDKVKLFLKYDGERDKNKYSVVVISENSIEDIKSIDTEEPLVTLQKILDENPIDNHEVNTLIQEFQGMKQKCIDYFGIRVIFIFTIKVEERVQLYISITKGRNNWKINSESMNQIEQYIDSSGEKNILNIAKTILEENREAFEELAK